MPSIIFNSPFETGVRSVFLLHAAFPECLDLERLVALDHFVVHTSDLGGPESLHPSTNSHASEMLVRRALVVRGLLLMQASYLVDRRAETTGILYRAGTAAASFVQMLTANYFISLKERAEYTVGLIGHLPEATFEDIVNRQLDRWAIQFRAAER
jgi:hypothetical protein